MPHFCLDGVKSDKASRSVDKVPKNCTKKHPKSIKKYQKV